MLTFNGILGGIGLWGISIFSFKVSQVFSNFLHEHVVHLKSEDFHQKIAEGCSNEAKAMEIFSGLWVASHPLPVSPSELMLQDNSLPNSSIPPQRVDEGGEKRRR